MEPGPTGAGSSRNSNGNNSGGRGGGGGGAVARTVVVGGNGGIATMGTAGAVQQMLVNAHPVPGPSTRPYLATPVQVPPHFLVPPEQLLPHQVRSGIDIGNLFKLLNALQNRIALACCQHQYLRDPLNNPRPPQDGGYKPLTPKAAVRDIRTLCKQQKNLMEKLRRWNCVNEGNCYDLITKNVFEGICPNCAPFAASRIRHRKVRKALKKKKAKAKRKALRQQKAMAARKLKQNQQLKLSVTTVVPKTLALSPQPVQQQPLRKRRKKSFGSGEPPHPDTFLSQESFLSELGLVTPEVYRKTQAESRRTERRRRTTANPKYKPGVFVDPNAVGQRPKRSLRGDPDSLSEPLASNALSSPSGAERRKARQRRYECTVCEKKDVTIECSKCLSGFHSDCIRVSASEAAPPTTVSVCPNCVACNPNISASDCILLSRKISRPSIMGLKSEPAQKSRLAKPRNINGRSQKTAYRRKTVAKTATKVTPQRKSAPPPPSPVKTKPKISFKQPQQTQTKPKKTQSGRKGKSSKQIPNSLNHSLAVAAAAAVPAYCTSLPSSVEMASEHENVKTAPPPPAPTPPPPSSPQKKRIPHVGIKWNKKLSKKRQGLEPRKPYPNLRKDIPSVLSSKYHLGTIEANKSVSVKAAAQLSPPQVNAVDTDKQKQKLQLSQADGESSKPKSPSLLSAQSNIIHPVRKQSELNKCKPKVGAVANEENHVPAVSPEVKKSNPNLSPNKPGSKKKSNGLKPVDPFCMKRTMMAMCAAAGIVMSTNGIKLPVLPQTSSSTATPPAAQPASLASTAAGGKEPSQSPPATSPTPTSTPVKSNVNVISPVETEDKSSQEEVTSKEEEVKVVIKVAAGKTTTPMNPPSTSTSNGPQATETKIPVVKKPKSTPKPVKPIDPALDRSISETIEFIIQAGIEGTLDDPTFDVPEKDKGKEIARRLPSDKQKKAKALATIITSNVQKTVKPAAATTIKTAKKAPKVVTVRNLFESSPKTVTEPNPKTLSEDLEKPPVLTKYTVEPFADVNRSYSYGYSCSNNELSRPASPSSNSSTIGSSRSLSDIVSNDSSDELLSIPDTSYSPYLELKMLDEPNPLLNFGTIDRMELLNRKVNPPSISPGSAKRGRPSGRGRANK